MRSSHQPDGEGHSIFHTSPMQSCIPYRGDAFVSRVTVPGLPLIGSMRLPLRVGDDRAFTPEGRGDPRRSSAGPPDGAKLGSAAWC